jgi:benzoyl-CoA reductase/2-hydroxyglutaryl-CoA dehydratase subunit BcrC/BadD/HgdB
MVMGSIIGIGDDKILDIIDQVGGRVVADNICTGLLNSRKDVIISGLMGNPLDALAERYLYNVPCPCMTDLDRRLNRTAQVIHTYNVSGVIYHCLKFCDAWRSEYPLIKDYLDKEVKVPSLIVESDYSNADTGTSRTKIEAFIEMIGE